MQSLESLSKKMHSLAGFHKLSDSPGGNKNPKTIFSKNVLKTLIGEERAMRIFHSYSMMDSMERSFLINDSINFMSQDRNGADMA